MSARATAASGRSLVRSSRPGRARKSEAQAWRCRKDRRATRRQTGSVRGLRSAGRAPFGRVGDAACKNPRASAVTMAAKSAPVRDAAIRPNFSEQLVTIPSGTTSPSAFRTAGASGHGCNAPYPAARSSASDRSAAPPPPPRPRPMSHRAGNAPRHKCCADRRPANAAVSGLPATLFHSVHELTSAVSKSNSTAS